MNFHFFKAIRIIRLKKLAYQLVWVSLLCSTLACQNQTAIPIAPLAKKGVLDLTQWDFQKNGNLELNGEWEFYPSQFIDYQLFKSSKNLQNQSLLTVPGNWNQVKLKGKIIGGLGYGTYHLRIRLNKANQMLALKIPTVSTAYELYVNGKKLVGVGKISQKASLSQAQYFPQAIDFQLDTNSLDIVFYVSNFHHQKGGLWEEIKLGTAKSILREQKTNIARDFFLSGSMLMMAFYHIALFFVRTKDRSTLYFGILCLIVTVRTLSTSDTLINQLLAIDWLWLIKLEYLSFYPIAVTFTIFVNAVFVWKGQNWVNYFCHITGALYVGMVLFTPTTFFSYLPVPFQLISFILGIYVCFILIWAIINHQDGALFFLLGFLFFFTTIINDILYLNHLVYTGLYGSIGVFIFMFSQSVLLSIRFSQAFSEKEKLSEELNYTNQNLERLVNEKTRSLQKTNEKLLEKQQDLKATEQKLLNSTIEILESNTALSSAKNELEKISSFQKSILQSAALSIITTDLEGFITSFNPTSENWLGYTTEAVLNQLKISSILSISKLNVENQKIDFKYLVENYQTNLDQAIECDYIRKNGSKFPVLLRISELKNEQNQTIAFLGLALDISASKNAEIKIRRQQNLLKEMGRFAKIAAWEYNLTTEEFVGSEELNSILGINSQLILKENAGKFSKLQEHSSFLNGRINKVIETGETEEFELKYSNQTWINYLITRVLNEENEYKIEVVVQDITARKIAEAEGQNTYLRLKTLVQNLQAGVLLEDEERKVSLSNQTFCDLFKIPLNPENLLGMDCSIYAEQSKHLFKYPQVFIDRVENLLRERKLIVNEVIELANGQFYERDFIPIQLDNQQLGHLWLYREVTQRKLQERTLILLNAEAIETNLKAQEQSYRMREQYKKIRDSIHYARRIQDSILPPRETILEILPHHFILYQPKDLVSGDFYWIEKLEGKTIIAAIDCTGHGVPGAFMSMLGNSFLDMIIIQNKILSADSILAELNQGIRTILKQEINDNRDGMDIGICVIDHQNNTLEFAGAHSNLIYVKNNEVHLIRGNRASIGGEQYKESFEKHLIPIDAKTLFYLYSDGYADQLGGEKGKKIMTNRFRELLLENHKLAMLEQKDILKKYLNNWRGELEQTDDVLVIGFKIT